jgi:ATPase subunit of ABC transporter with duplicated ATPase domains
MDPRTRSRKVLPYEGNYSTYLDKKAKRLEQESREDEGRSKAIKDELEWIRAGTKGRQTKSKARIKAFDQWWNRRKPASSTRPRSSFRCPSVWAAR